MKKKSKTINKCQVSGVKDLKTIISLGFLPPVNKMQKVGNKKETVFFPADLMYSKSSNSSNFCAFTNKYLYSYY